MYKAFNYLSLKRQFYDYSILDKSKSKDSESEGDAEKKKPYQYSENLPGKGDSHSSWKLTGYQQASEQQRE